MNDEDRRKMAHRRNGSLGAEAIDLVGPAFIEFSEGRSGHFRFIAMDGWMDCLHKERNGWPYVEFTWDGKVRSSQWSRLGQSSRRTAPCVAAFTFMVATTRVQGDPL
jgi:hypothetical protein